MPTISTQYQVFIAPKKSGAKPSQSKSFYKNAKSHIVSGKKKGEDNNLSQTVDKTVYGVDR